MCTHTHTHTHSLTHTHTHTHTHTCTLSHTHTHTHRKQTHTNTHTHPPTHTHTHTHTHTTYAGEAASVRVIKYHRSRTQRISEDRKRSRQSLHPLFPPLILSPSLLSTLKSLPPPPTLSLSLLCLS